MAKDTYRSPLKSEKTSTPKPATPEKSTAPEPIKPESPGAEKPKASGDSVDIILDALAERIAERMKAKPKSESETKPVEKPKAEAKPEPKKSEPKSDKPKEPVCVATSCCDSSAFNGPGKAYRYWDYQSRSYLLTTSIWRANQAGNGEWDVIWVWYKDGEIHHVLDNEELRKYCP